MNIKISPNLKLICNVITSQIEKRNGKQFELAQLLANLNAVEMYVVASSFCSLNWNLGSLRVLNVLQKLRILTASEYLIRQKDNEDVQLILNDLLEEEHELLSNLFITIQFDPENGEIVGQMLNEMLQRLFADLLVNPSLCNLKYLDALPRLLPSIMLPKFTQKHLSVMLSLHSSTHDEAFTHFTNWINEGVDELKFIAEIYKKLLHLNPQEVLGHLFKISTAATFKSWKFYLILLQTIAAHSIDTTGAFIRNYFKGRLLHIAAVPQKTSLQHLLLSVRAATATTMDVHKNVDAYADWYKRQIGEMKFVLKTEEFQNVLQLLEQCIEQEVDEDYADVHASIVISPPVLCGKMVQAYRSKCKSHLARLKAQVRAKPVEVQEILSSSDEQPDGE